MQRRKDDIAHWHSETEPLICCRDRRSYEVGTPSGGTYGGVRDRGLVSRASDGRPQHAAMGILLLSEGLFSAPL